MFIENTFEIGQTVYLKTDPDQLERFVTGLFVRPGNRLMYELACAEDTSQHYDFEISAERDAVKAAGFTSDDAA
jgi:hypothetical protein